MVQCDKKEHDVQKNMSWRKRRSESQCAKHNIVAMTMPKVDVENDDNPYWLCNNNDFSVVKSVPNIQKTWGINFKLGWEKILLLKKHP